MSDSRNLSRKNVMHQEILLQMKIRAWKKIGCEQYDKTEDVVISMLEVGMMMPILMITVIIIMLACQRCKLINNSNVMKLLKVIRE